MIRPCPVVGVSLRNTPPRSGKKNRGRNRKGALSRALSYRLVEIAAWAESAYHALFLGGLAKLALKGPEKGGL